MSVNREKERLTKIVLNAVSKMLERDWDVDFFHAKNILIDDINQECGLAATGTEKTLLEDGYYWCVIGGDEGPQICRISDGWALSAIESGRFNVERIEIIGDKILFNEKAPF